MFFSSNGFRKARHKAKMTQTQVANEIGVSPVTVLQWEKGTNVPNKGNLEKLANLYGVTKYELLKEDENQNE